MALKANFIMEKHPLNKYVREDVLPHILCPGCGIGTVINAVARALKNLEVPPEDVVVVSGIGCSGRASGYFNTDSVHTTHGRALPLATAIKITKPHMKVIVIAGDGDLFAIGGNHFIHSARRNIDLTVIAVNNFNYGMTGGQLGPTTPSHAVTSTSKQGNFEHPFNLVHLAAAAGAVYVARWTTFHVNLLTKSIEKAISKRGFSFIDVISQCPTYFDRYNRLGDAVSALKLFQKRSVIKNGYDPALAIADPFDKIICGEFVNKERPEYSERLQNIIKERMREVVKNE